MFDIAWSEFLVVAVVALVVVGPRELPALLRTVGKTVASLRRMAGEFQSQFNEAMREAELDDLKNQVTGLKDAANKAVGASPFQIARDELKNALTDIKGKPTTAAPSALAGDAPQYPRPGEVAQIPSALAPPPPETPPAPSEADFAKSAIRQAAATENPTPKPDDGAPAAVSETEPQSAPSAPDDGDKPSTPREPGAAA